jgi:hypothetical protein
MRGCRCCRGQVVPLVAVVVLAAGVGVVALGRLGQAAVARASARTAADAAALAGAAEGEPSARAVAAANGGRVVSYRSEGHDVEVVVVVAGGGRARARARSLAGSAAGVAGPDGPAPALRAALARAAQLLGRPVPGQGRGLAIDVPLSFVPALAAVAGRAGLCQPAPERDPVHFEVCRGG